MQVNIRRGKQEIQFFKGDAKCLMEAAYLLEFVARVSGTEQEGQAAGDAATTLRVLTAKYGTKYLDGEGNLKLTERESAV